MAEIRIKDNESLESALRRFKKQCARGGIIQEVRKREAYEKPSVKRKKKSNNVLDTEIKGMFSDAASGQYFGNIPTFVGVECWEWREEQKKDF